MDLDTAFDIEDADALDRHADYIVSADEKLIEDLVARRKELGLTQQAVADRMGIDKSNVSRIERGDGDLLQSTLRRFVMALDAVVIHEVRDFRDVDNSRKARQYFAGSTYEAATTRPMPVQAASRADSRDRVMVST